MTCFATEGSARPWVGASQHTGFAGRCHTPNTCSNRNAAKAPSRGEGRALPGQAGRRSLT